MGNYIFHGSILIERERLSQLFFAL